MNFRGAVEVMSVRELAMSGVGVSFSEITESKKRQASIGLVLFVGFGVVYFVHVCSYLT
jgi:hypothetical protein